MEVCRTEYGLRQQTCVEKHLLSVKCLYISGFWGRCPRPPSRGSGPRPWDFCTPDTLWPPCLQSLATPLQTFGFCGHPDHNCLIQIPEFGSGFLILYYSGFYRHQEQNMTVLGNESQHFRRQLKTLFLRNIDEMYLAH